MTSHSENRTISYSLFELLRLDVLRVQRLSHGAQVSPPNSLLLWLHLLSPFILPVLIYRISYYFQFRNMRPLAKMFACLNSFLFGIEIASSCSIGPGLFIPHPHGTVIGAWSIGCNVTIFQGVTLGAKHLAFDFAKSSRPVLADNIIIGAGSKILGGISVGRDSVVGANSVVLSDVPPGCIAVGVPAKVRSRYL